jgi:hypothetical protein
VLALGKPALPTGTLPAATGTADRTGTAGNFTLPTLPALTGAGRTGTAGNFALATLPTLPAVTGAPGTAGNFALATLPTLPAGAAAGTGTAVTLPGRGITGID